MEDTPSRHTWQEDIGGRVGRGKQQRLGGNAVPVRAVSPLIFLIFFEKKPLNLVHS